MNKLFSVFVLAISFSSCIREEKEQLGKYSFHNKTSLPVKLVFYLNGSKSTAISENPFVVNSGKQVFVEEYSEPGGGVGRPIDLFSSKADSVVLIDGNNKKISYINDWFKKNRDGGYRNFFVESSWEFHRASEYESELTYEITEEHFTKDGVN